METFAQDPLANNVSSGADSSHESHLLRNVNEITPALPSPNAFDEAEASSTDTLSLEKETATNGGGIQVEGSCRCFSLDEVQRATNDFDDALVIGFGGFGKVYKGIIDDGGATTTVAIKRLNAESKQGAEEFRTEVKLLSRLQHTHLVSLIGYCYKLPEMILVYEYIARGTLASHLYKTSREESGKTISQLTWEQRLKICLGAARGLDYLHNGTELGIIHRDVKSTNILLDENLVAKVSDFGLSKSITSQITTHVSTNVKGTIGYLDPDYFYTKRLTKKSDVYAFGVVLLEVLCSRPPVDTRLEEEQISLILWATMHIKKGKLDGIIDPSLNGETTPRNLKYFAELANKCLHTQPKERPTMAEVVESLEIASASQERKGRSLGTILKAFQGIKLVPKGMNHWWREGKSNGGGPIDDLTQSVYRRFSVNEIRSATNDFNGDLLIGQDTWFRWYKGRMVGGTLEVAIKRYDSIVELNMTKLVSAEIGVQSLSRHPNIVPLIGFCYENDESILVYEYMVNGTLSSHLWGTNNNPLLWKKRLDICIDIARGLEYLHTNVDLQFILGCINPLNVFLDDKWVAKVAAFDFSTPITKTITVRTARCLDPEYWLYGKVTKKSVVYSFGVLLLEVLCANTGEPTLVPSKFYKCFKGGTIDEVIDPCLMGKIAPGCFRNFVFIALSCMLRESIRRPSMDAVLGSLQSTLQLQEAWENSNEMGDELPMADVPSSYNNIISVDSEFTIGEQSFLISDLDGFYARSTSLSFPEPSTYSSKLKRNSDGTIARHKARLVARGNQQTEGLDYTETFSPVVKQPTLRVVLSLAVHFGWSLKQLDVTNAFLHGMLQEEVYMTQPPGYKDPSRPSYVCKLHKALYGLKQAPRAWYALFSSHLTALGFQNSMSDTSLFVKQHGPDLTYVLIYVDDIIVTGNNTSYISSLLSQLQRKFALKDLGDLHYFLGIEVIRDTSGLFLTQKKYALELLAKAGMVACKPSLSPSSTKPSLSSDSSSPFPDVQLYRSLVGSLQYLTLTKPELSHAVNSVCQYMHAPTQSHFAAVKRILRYVKGSLHQGLHFTPSPLFVIAYCDADWASDHIDRRSTSGFGVFLGDNLVSWSAKKQPTVARSSTEAEYRSLAHTAAELLWMQQLLTDLHISLDGVPVVFCDNLSAIALASIPIFHARTKHIEVDYHFVREKVVANQLVIHHVSSEAQIADLFTKPLSVARFQDLSSKLKVQSLPLSLRGAVSQAH